MENNKKIIDLGILPEDEYSGVSAIALVEEPAIELDFRYFKKQNFVHPSIGESHDDFIGRCIPVLISEGKENDQAVAVCESYWTEKMAATKVSFDYDDTLSTDAGKELAKKAIADGEDVYIISARNDKEGMLSTAKDLGIDASKVFATGSNKAKIEKIKELGIDKHIDNNKDVISELGAIGEQFEIDTTGLTPYVDPGVKPKRIEEVYSKDVLDTILAMAAELGYPETECTIVNNKFATDPKSADYTPARTITKADGVERLYQYKSSRVAGNSRDFCTRLMGLRRFYSREEIDAMDSFNTEFGAGIGGGNYSIFKYKGGTNCQHYWQAYDAERTSKGLVLTEAQPEDAIQMTAATAPRTNTGRGYVKRPQRSLPPLSGHSAFSKLMFADEEQRIVVGPCMIPDMNILRRDEDGETYYVKFSTETIKEIAMKYMKQARTNDINEDHDPTQNAGTYIFESWLVESADDKANTLYGYDVPVGTWMCKMKVEDPETWKRIKNGELRGFSVEGDFADMEEIEYKRKYDKIKQILKG
jgi:hypothetical protein